MQTQIMVHTTVNGSDHTGCKQHQRVCMQICMQICLCVLCEWGLTYIHNVCCCTTSRKGVTVAGWSVCVGQFGGVVQHLHSLQGRGSPSQFSTRGVGGSLSPLSTRGGGHVLQTLFPKPSDWGGRRTQCLCTAFCWCICAGTSHPQCLRTAFCWCICAGTSHPRCLCTASCFQFFEVRQNAVCVAGLHRDAVQDIKNQIGSLLQVPIPLESFHVKFPSDTKVRVHFQTFKRYPHICRTPLFDLKKVHNLIC